MNKVLIKDPMGNITDIPVVASFLPDGSIQIAFEPGENGLTQTPIPPLPDVSNRDLLLEKNLKGSNVDLVNFETFEAAELNPDTCPVTNTRCQNGCINTPRGACALDGSRKLPGRPAFVVTNFEAGKTTFTMQVTYFNDKSFKVDIPGVEDQA